MNPNLDKVLCIRYQSLLLRKDALDGNQFSLNMVTGGLI